MMIKPDAALQTLATIFAEDSECASLPDVEAQAVKPGQEAFCDAYLRWSKRLYCIALERVGNPHEAEDIVSETFKRAWESPSMPQQAGSALPWLLGVMRHLILDHYRAKKHAASKEKALATDVFSEVDPLVPVKTEVLKALTDAVQNLPVSYRDILVAHYFEGKSIRAIAEQAGVPVNTVKWWLWEGRRRLREDRHLLELFFTYSASDQERA